MADLPVIVLAFANEQAGHRYLRNLPEEVRQVQRIVEDAARRGLCESVTRSNATFDAIDKVFESHQERVAILWPFTSVATVAVV
jgi:hypothetical protein